MGNKIDSDNRIISTERGEKVANEYKLPYMETSAKTNTNIVELFFDMAERILESVIMFYFYSTGLGLFN